MEKKIYVAPSVSYIGPDLKDCQEINTPVATAVLASNVANMIMIPPMMVGF